MQSRSIAKFQPMWHAHLTKTQPTKLITAQLYYIVHCYIQYYTQKNKKAFLSNCFTFAAQNNYHHCSFGFGRQPQYSTVSMTESMNAMIKNHPSFLSHLSIQFNTLTLHTLTTVHIPIPSAPALPDFTHQSAS